MFLLSFFLNFNSSFLKIIVPVGLLGFAKKTIFVLFETLERIESTEILKFFSLA